MHPAIAIRIGTPFQGLLNLDGFFPRALPERCLGLKLERPFGAEMQEAPLGSDNGMLRCIPLSLWLTLPTRLFSPRIRYLKNREENP